MEKLGVPFWPTAHVFSTVPLSDLPLDGGSRAGAQQQGGSGTETAGAGPAAAAPQRDSSNRSAAGRPGDPYAAIKLRRVVLRVGAGSGPNWAALGLMLCVGAALGATMRPFLVAGLRRTGGGEGEGGPFGDGSARPRARRVSVAISQ